ncbi:MAG: ABC transporter substrate-binding protein [Dongiaceae bacterium]
MLEYLRSGRLPAMAAGLILSCGIMANGSAALAAEKLTVMIGVSWPPYAIWSVIKEKNLAPDLDLDIVYMDDPIQAHGLLAAGQADLLMNTIDYAPIIAEEKMPIRLVSFASLDYGSSQILAGPGIDSPADLRGKTVGALEGYIAQLMMVLWLKEGGVEADEVNWVNLTPEEVAAAMISGDVAAGYTWDPWASQIVENLEGSKSISNAKQDYWLQTALLSDSVFMNTDFIHTRRDVAIQAMRAYFDGIAWWRANVAEGNAIIADVLGYPIADVDWVLGTDGTSLDAALRMYDFMEAAQFCGVAPGEPPHDQANGQIWRTFSLTNEVWKTVGLNQAIVPATRAIDCSLLREMYETGYAGEPDPNY